MSPEKYNLYKFFLDIIMDVVMVLVGIFVEKKWTVSRIFSWWTKEENKQQVEQKGKCNQAAVSEKGDVKNENIGGNKTEINIAGDVNIATPQKILNNPPEPSLQPKLSGKATIICEEFSKEFTTYRISYDKDIRIDYSEAENKKSINPQHSILIYKRIFNSIASFIEKYRGDENFAREMRKNLDELDEGNFEKIINVIETKLIDYLEKSRI